MGTATTAQRWRSLAALLVLSAVACDRARPDAVLATVTTPVLMEFVRHDEPTVSSGAGRGGIPGIPGFRTIGLIRIHSQPVRTVETSCEPVAPQLRSDATGARVAYRCRPDDLWSVVYLPDPQRAFAACDPVGRDAQEINWRALPTFEAAAVSLAPCNADVVGFIRARGQDAGVAAFLADALDLPLQPATDRSGDVWIREYQRLGPAMQEPLHQRLRAALTSRNPGEHVLWRALSILDLDDAALQDALLDRARELAAPNTVDTQRRLAARALLLHVLARRRPAEAGALGCEIVARPGMLPDPYALIAVARARTPCPAVARWLAVRSCSVDLDCGPSDGARHLCAAEELAPILEAPLARPAAEAPAFAPDSLWTARAVLGTGYALGIVGDDIVRRNARRHYTLEQPAQPRCFSAHRGQPCSCFEQPTDVAGAICTMSLAQTEGRTSDCTFRVDDAAHRITAIVGARAN